MSDELFDEMLRDIARALKRMRMLRDEIEAYFTRMMFGVEELYEDRLRSMSSEFEEPLVEIRDVGDEILVLIDVSGVKEETIDVRVGEDTIVVMGEADIRKVEEALRGWHLARTKRAYKGVYRLPYKIDPSSVVVEKKGSLIVIRAKKISP